MFTAFTAFQNYWKIFKHFGLARKPENWDKPKEKGRQTIEGVGRVFTIDFQDWKLGKVLGTSLIKIRLIGLQ